MPTLTRRRYPERPDCWHVYYGDVRVGTIARRVGNPHDTDPWEWDCGFYPGSHPREHKIPPRPSSKPAPISNAPGQRSYRTGRRPISRRGDQQAWTAEKYRRFDRGERMPPDWAPQRPSWLHQCSKRAVTETRALASGPT